MAFTFTLEAQDGAARAGRITTDNGEVLTPAFMPVGTAGSVKTLAPGELTGAGADILLANTYHLALRPGVETVREMGGLHRFMGWPGSILEFHKLIPLLAPHFHVVAPSLPGYTLSFAPGQPRFGTQEIAACFADLMALLGYARFGAQGGDWGGFISSVLGHRYPERLIGIHLNLLALPREPKIAAPTQEEAAYLKDLRHFAREETGYQWIQGTRPQTLAFALTDSPAGLAAWIAEKFRAWSDCGGAIENAISRDELLANVSLYWFTGAIGSSFWPYYARRHGPWPIPEGEKVRVPTGYAAFPKEIVRPPKLVNLVTTG